MVSDDIGRALHHKSVLGPQLTTEEKAQLAEWCQFQDSAETKFLASDKPYPDLAAVRSEIDHALEQLSAVTHELKQIKSANDALRAENAALKDRLGARHEPQTA